MPERTAELREDVREPEETGVPQLAEMSDAWLFGRARELIAILQGSMVGEQLGHVRTIDALLAETQRRGEPFLVARMLRYAAIGHLVTPSLAEAAEPLLDEMLAHTRRHGLTVLRADAHALRGRRLVLAGQDDTALTEIARALAILDEQPIRDRQIDKRTWDQLLSSALMDSWSVLNQLGVYEAAEEVIARAHHAVRESAAPHEITLQLLNRVKMLLGWALRLERIGRGRESREKFHTAASMAVAVEGPFSESLFPRRPGIPAVEQVGVLAAAVALTGPAPEHIERLQRLRTSPGFEHDRVLTALALARCLETAGRKDEAITALRDTAAIDGERTQSTMRLNLVRELARLRFGNELQPMSGHLISEYAGMLEAELWSLRESQQATLQARREHARLSAEHGAITKQAMHDPLTGLPNRRALDERLHTLSSAADAQPLAVALIDLDGFKGVNDTHSHADGDNVLRVVASTLRDTLRGDDIVARYGGDEFIVLLPGAPVSSATQALGRSVTAVSDLPYHLSHGVTLSVGLVSLRPQERAEEVLSRADAAMYQAKRRGGNQVSSTSAGSGEVSDEYGTTDPTWGAGGHA